MSHYVCMVLFLLNANVFKIAKSAIKICGANGFHAVIKFECKLPSETGQWCLLNNIY